MHAVDPSTLHDDAPAPPSSPDERLAENVWRARIYGLRLNVGERALALVAGVCIPLGLLVIGLGWYGASHTANLYEQNPFMISGGQLGIALVTVGGFCYFGHWLTEILRQQHAQTAALLDAFRDLETVIRGTMTEDGAITTTDAPSANGRALVATSRGTMAHRPDCVIVAGKPRLRSVRANEQLRACKYCEPYGPNEASSGRE